MVRGRVAKVENELFTLSIRMDRPDPTFDAIKMSLNLLKHCSVRLPQEVDDSLEGPPCPVMARKMDIPIEDHGPSNSDINFTHSSANYHTANFGPLPFPNTTFPAIPPPLIGMKCISTIPLTAFNSPALFQYPIAISHGRLVPISPASRFRRRCLPRIR